MIYKKRSIFLWGILSLAPLYATHIDFPNPYKAKYAVNAYKDSGTTVYSPNGLSLKNGAQFNGATGISNISISAAPSDKSVGGTIGWTDSGYPDHLEIKLPHESTRTAGNQVILTVHDDKVQKPLIIPSMDDSAYFHKKTIKNNLDVDCVLQAFTKGDGSTNSTKINLYLKNSYGAPQVIQDISISKGSTVDVWSILIYDHTYTINFPSDSSDSTITLLDHVHSKYIKNSTDKTITVTVNGSDSTNKGTFTVDNGKQVTWYNEASGFASLDIVVGTQKITLSHSGGTNSKGDSSYTLNDIIGLEINMQQDSSNSPAYVVVGIEDNHGKFSQYVPDKPSGTPQASTLMYLDVQCTSEKNIRLQYYNASNQLLQSFPYDGSSQLIDFVVSNTHGSRLTTATYDPSLIDHIVCTVGTGSSTTNFVADSTFNPLTIFASQATALKNGIDASPGTKMATVSFGAQNSDGSIPVSFFVDSNSTDGLYSTKITTTASGSGSTTTNSNYKLNNTSGWDLDISIIKKDNSLSSSVRVTKDNKPQNIYYDTNDIKG
ncbi:hypothetical protein EBR77_03220, partial [bacterium]|nr:hypothetical protein [bacterium]